MPDALKLLNVVPFGELVKAQRSLGLSAGQVWYIATYWSAEAEGDTELSDLTGVARSTVRDLRQSLADMGLFHDQEGFAPLIAKLVAMRDVKGETTSPEESTPRFDTLEAYEQLLILDQFSCRLCFKKWNMNGTGGTEFRMRKVTAGETVFASRAIICEECIPNLGNKDIVDRLRLYISHRADRLHDLEGRPITDLEYTSLERIKAKRATESDSVVTNSPLTDLKDRASGPYARPYQRASIPLPVDSLRAEADTKDTEDCLATVFSTKDVEKTGNSQKDANFHVSPKRSKKSITSEQEEPTEDLENADEALLPANAKAERKASKKAQDIMSRTAKRLEAIKNIPYDEWTTPDLSIWFWSKHYAKYGYTSQKESLSERQKHVSDILLSLEGNVGEFVKFTAWVMANWHALPFIREDMTPTTRNVSIRMGDILPHYYGGTRDIAINQTKANPHIDAVAPEIPDWVVGQKKEESNGERPHLKLPDFAAPGHKQGSPSDADTASEH